MGKWSYYLADALGAGGDADLVASNRRPRLQWFREQDIQFMARKIGLVIIGDEILSGKRRDKHLLNAARIVGQRGLAIDWVQIERDNLERLVEVFSRANASGAIVFSFGGIGATPDDVTRAAAARALGVCLQRHPAIVQLLERRFGADAYPNRIRMAEVPEGANLIDNPLGLIPGFSLRDLHFLPGFPEMSASMMEQVLELRYGDLKTSPKVEQLIDVLDVPESELVPILEDLTANYPDIQLSSLPGNGRPWRVEIGVKGQSQTVALATGELQSQLDQASMKWQLGPLLQAGQAGPRPRNTAPSAS